MRKIAITVAAVAALGGMHVAQADILDIVQDRGAVHCGVTTGFAGFSAPDSQGEWQGLDIDMCKAVDKDMQIQHVHLQEKLGGKSGHYVRSTQD